MTPAWLTDLVNSGQVTRWDQYRDADGIDYWRVWYRLPRFDGTQVCADYGMAMWFLEDGETYARNGQGWRSEAAERIDKGALLCRQCKFQQACAEYGVAHEEHGTWGGLLPGDRDAVRQERNQMVNRVTIYSTMEDLNGWDVEHVGTERVA